MRGSLFSSAIMCAVSAARLSFYAYLILPCGIFLDKPDEQNKNIC